jgi:hypothetical protein
MHILTATELIEAKLNEADQGMINHFHKHLAEKGFKRQPDFTITPTSGDMVQTWPSDHPHGSEPWQEGTRLQYFSHHNGPDVFLKPLDDGTVEYRTGPAPMSDLSPSNSKFGGPPTKLGTDFSEFQSTLAAGNPSKNSIKAAQRMAKHLIMPIGFPGGPRR